VNADKDYDLLRQAVDALATADIVHKFTDKVWIAVDRTKWDEFMKTRRSYEHRKQRTYQQVY